MIRFDDILRMRQKELKHYLAGHLKKLGYETVKKRAQCRCCWSPIWTPYIMSCRISSADPKTGAISCPRKGSAATTGAAYI